MYIPPLYRAVDVPRLDLDQRQARMCNKIVRLGDCLVTWTHPVGQPENTGWYVVCNRTCYTRNCTEGME